MVRPKPITVKDAEGHWSEMDHESHPAPVVNLFESPARRSPGKTIQLHEFAEQKLAIDFVNEHRHQLRFVGDLNEWCRQLIMKIQCARDSANTELPAQSAFFNKIKGFFNGERPRKGVLGRKFALDLELQTAISRYLVSSPRISRFSSITDSLSVFPTAQNPVITRLFGVKS